MAVMVSGLHFQRAVLNVEKDSRGVSDYATHQQELELENLVQDHVKKRNDAYWLYVKVNVLKF